MFGGFDITLQETEKVVLFWQVYTCLKLTELPLTTITTNYEGLIDTDPVRSLVTELSPHCCTACSRH